MSRYLQRGKKKKKKTSRVYHNIGAFIVHPAGACLFYKVLLSVLFPSEWKQFSEEGTWKTSFSVAGGDTHAAVIGVGW